MWHARRRCRACSSRLGVPNVVEERAKLGPADAGGLVESTTSRLLEAQVCHSVGDLEQHHVDLRSIEFLFLAAADFSDVFERDRHVFRRGMLMVIRNQPRVFAVVAHHALPGRAGLRNLQVAAP